MQKGVGTLNFIMKRKPSFRLCGFFTETSLETCGDELHRLWEYYDGRKKELFDLFGKRKDFYGLMWKTSDSRYCYLIGIEADGGKGLPEGAVFKTIPAAEYAVACVSPEISAFDAWTEFYYKALPAAGYTPNAGHDFDFEYYPNGADGIYELWTPATRK